MLSCLAVLLIQPQASPITLDVRAASSHVVLQKLGDKMGVKMIPGGSVVKDYFAVAFNATPPDRVLAHTAKTLNAEWQRGADGTYVLTRTPAQERTEELLVAERLRSQIRLEIEKNSKAEPFDEEKATQLIQEAGKLADRLSEDKYWQEAWKFSAQMPAQRFLNRIIALIGPDEWAMLPSGKRASYSFTPTRRQRALPASVKPAMDEYVRELRVQIGAVEKLGVTNDNRERYVPLYQRPFEGDLTGLKIKLSATRHEYGYTSVTLTITNKAGSTEVVNAGFSIDRVMVRDGSAPPPAPFAALAKGLTDPIELDPLAKEIVKELRARFGGRSAGGANTPPPAVALREMMRNLVKTDPLEYLADAPFRQLAKAKSKDMVALLPDMAMFGLSLEQADSAQSLESYFASQNLAGMFTISEEDGYLSVRPLDPIQARKSRWPRAAVTDLCKALEEKGLPDLDTIADFVAATDDDLQVQFALVLTMTAIDMSENMMIGMSENLDLLRLYGRLNRPERARVRDGGIILNLNATTPAVTAIIDKLIFDRDAELTAELPQHDGPANANMRYATARESGEDGVVLESDPFVALGNGYAPGSQLRLRMATPTHLFARRSKSQYGGSTNAYSLGDLANQMAWEATPQYQTQNYKDSPIDLFAMAPQTELFADFDFKQAGFMQHMYVAPMITKETVFGPIDSLPEQIRKEFEVLLARARENYKNVQFGGSGQGTRPPPPLLR